ncbi:helix-turn-helix domain-containing protein [Saccharibacillus alkalitolerans]|uniref:AraC family transcriptional regulator n=1 Tax=Saccharibacillus alkalitolerans TaxID=2705290 RepID=A0ABX0F8D6_9BACL|nr:AraC family transcriptional regulator [Saccharibacillus alkalitolerans]NGZ77213.1 AraC family transcriptional regulator [Saccharibacillus alkalitolerans]
MKRFPMTLQLALILFIVMVIPASILTWYSGEQSFRDSERQIAESSLAELVAGRRLNENALNNLAQDVVRLSAIGTFDRLRPFPTYDEISADYGRISRAMTVMRELTNLNHRADGIYSSFFYMQDSDYVVSTDRSITRLERYEDLGWIDEALERRSGGIAGIWVPRKLDSGVKVVSYVLPLNRLSTTTKGTIVINVRESQLGQYMYSANEASAGYALIDGDGTMVSSPDKSLLLKNIADLPVYGELLKNSPSEGYAFREVNGDRLLYAWSDSQLLGWTHVGVFSVQELLTQTHARQSGLVLMTAIIIFVGAFVTLLLATWLSRPARQLVRRLNEESGAKLPRRNEFAFLEDAFLSMRDEESRLHTLLQQRERDARSLAVQHLLRGEVTRPVEEIFPYEHFRVAAISIDGYRQYVSKHNSETRSYHRYLLSGYCDSLFEEGITSHFLYRGDGYFTLVINDGREEGERGGIRGLMQQLASRAEEVLGHTVTIGLSGEKDDAQYIRDLAAEASEAVKRRMIAGSGGIHCGPREDDGSGKYIYPAHSERRILNFLDAGDLAGIDRELDKIVCDIRSADSVSYDNILFIYNQLVGVTIKHLRENDNHAARIVAGRGSVYSVISSLDTLNDLQAYLHEFYAEVVSASAKPASSEAASHGERIAAYLREHYREEVVFEDMASELGISYSYMRKIAYETLGCSLIDYLNKLRVEEAKRLLLAGGRTITEIAAEVGYENARSFNRFFHKYEGMAPSAYKTKQRTS